MVTRLGAFSLMNLVLDLSYVYERCRSMIMYPRQPTQVKGENYILDVLLRQRGFVSALAKKYQELQPVSSGLTSWVAYLDKRYVQQTTFFGPPINLDHADAQRLSDDIEQWRALLLSVYQQEGTVFIKEETLDSIFPEAILSKLDAVTREDLSDVLLCVLHLLPTPAAMIGFRVAESIIRRYYERVTSQSASGKTLAQILQQMEQGQLMTKSALGYARFLKDKRNEAQHPDKRFTQEESERIILRIKDLLDELKA